MRYFFIFLILIISGCKKDAVLSRPSFKKDPIHLDYEKKVSSFQKEYDDIAKGISDAKERINDSSFAPKMAELIKNEIFVQEKYLRIIDQEISYLRIMDNERSKYYLENAETLTEEKIKKDHEAYLIQEKANPKKYIWRMRPGLVLPDDPKAKKKKEEHKEAPKGH
jgi:hypothetical protein